MMTRAMVQLGCVLLILCSAARPLSAQVSKASAAPAEAARHFDANIAPLLARHCLECHDSASKEGGLDLSRQAATLAGGESGKAIVPGKGAESLLWQYVESNEMPPENRPKLSDEEKRHLRQWIDAGAVWSAETIDPLAYRRDRRAASNWIQRLTVPEYIETVRSAVGVDIEQDAHRILPPDMRADGFSNTAYNLNLDLGHVEAYAKLAEVIVGRMDVTAFAAEHAPARPAFSNMREVVSGIGKWLLRGPLDQNEINAFLAVSTAVAKEGGNADEAVRYIIEAMLQSPRFIYRIEDQRGDAAAQQVNDYELASRLSYILWGGPPDKELMQAADRGELSDRRRAEEQVQRMLQDPRTIAWSARFIHEWLDLDRLSNMRPNPDRFPNWNDQLATDMRYETLAFFHDVVWQRKRPLSDLMNAQVTYATPRLADHYGLDRKYAESDAGLKVDVSRPVARNAAGERVTNGLQMLYTFNEKRGDAVRDLSGSSEPVDLKIADSSAVRWTDDGLVVNSATLIASERPAGRLIDAARRSGAISLEAWITPANASQSGPARIVTLSDNISVRNFTLGQSGDRFEIRLRTTKTSRNGEPSLSGPSGTASTRRLHVIYTRDAAGKAKLYVDGQEKAARDVGGDLSNWDGNFRLALANELSKDRPWLGTLHLVAVYSHALSADEVRRNHAAGIQAGRADSGRAAGSGPPAIQWASTASQRIQDDLQALYRFDQMSGDTIRDVSNVGEPLNLKIENASAVAWDAEGLTVMAPTLIATAGPPKRLTEAIKKSKAATLEAWITPANTRQNGPARILTLSSGSSQRNFTLGQDGDKFDARFRTTTRDANGLPSLASPSGSVHTRPIHVVYTRGATGSGILYIDGEEKAARAVDGNLSNWNDGFRLAIANESTKDRPWQGTYHLVAIYSRALTGDEVRRNHAAGPNPAGAGGVGLARFDLTSVPARGGLLTQGSVLTVGGDEASMVARGLFVLHDLLYSAVGSPPPCVDTAPVPTKPGLTQRRIAEMRLADRSCSGCHSKFEPLAFGLEKFDGLGTYYDRDKHGNELREDGEILFPGEAQPVSYQTSAELMDLLASSERVRMNITRKVTQFALGRPLVESDAAMLDKIHAAAWEGGGTYASLITAIVMSDLVRSGRTESRGNDGK